MTDAAITFEPCPRRTGGTGSTSHGAIAEQLRARPSEWAHILTLSTTASSASTAYTIRNGRRRAWSPAGSFEARSRTVDGEHRVYARYIGTPTA